ncbi:sulfite exporter TauE/SafE family protein [Brevibacterium samyangense]|uniref:Probable membrane transporter protein n=1 Tax=Brevibacterium samyangense TaxID=366888 RepID=A0ABN2T6G6_9MICO
MIVPVVLVLVLASVLIGALLQRTTGMGFGLVAGPFLVLLLDPIAGVVLVNMCGAVSAAIILVRVRREVRWKRMLVLSAGSLLGILPGAWLAVRAEASVLYLVVGGLIVLGLTVSLLGSRYAPPMAPSPVKSVAFGTASGFMAGAAGVGGPAISAYALMTRWEQRTFAATLQPYFVVNSLAAIAAKLLFDRAAVPHLPWQMWVGILVAMLLGQVLGDVLAKKVEVSTARTLMIVLAFAGAVLTLAKGIWGLV